MSNPNKKPPFAGAATTESLQNNSSRFEPESKQNKGEQAKSNSEVL